MALLSTIDDRSREIFRRIVENYLATGDATGSRTLAQGGLGVSPATIRNAMADLTDMGLLHAPHISAGRVPTESGLRLFVDGLLELGHVSDEERHTLEAQMRAASDATNLEDVLDDAATRLSGLTQTASLIITSKNEAPLKHIEFVQTSAGGMGKKQALVVMVFENGDIENRLVTLPAGLPVSVLVEAGNYLNAKMRGRTLSEAKMHVLDEIDKERAALNGLTQDLIRQGIAEMAGGSEGHEPNLIVRGRAHLLDDGAAEDIERVRMLFEDLERKKGVIDLLEAAKEGEGVRIFIGSENNMFSLSGSSIIVKPYRDRAQNIIGVLGVIGPTRINYARIIPMVDYTADVITRLLK